MVSCNIVAKLTQSKYGIWIYIIHFLYGNTEYINQIKVNNTNNISIAARILFFNQNCIGVKIKLKNRLRINGSTTLTVTFFL